MAMHHVNPQGAKLTTLDPIWERVRNEAEDIVRSIRWCIAWPTGSITPRCRST